MDSADAVVIGAGVIGTSIAFRLAQQGREVIVVEQVGPGSGASGSCDKAIFLQSKRPGIHMELALASRRMYDSLGAELDADIELKGDGGMVVIESAEQLEFMKGFIGQQQSAGISVELLDAAQTRERQPCISHHVLGASHSPDDAEVNPLALNAAFYRAALRLGARFQTHTEVIAIDSQHGRITGLTTTRGQIAAPVVINAAGPQARHVGALAGVEVPVEPRRGTILISEALPHLVHGNVLCAQYIAAKHLASVNPENAPPFGIGLSLGQTDSGNLLIGGSRQFTGFDKPQGVEVMRAIAKHAVRLVPSLRDTQIIRSMTGFRPSTGDGLPIISTVPELTGYVVAAGHEGDGIALAPITGSLVAELLEAGQPRSAFLPALSIDRFSDTAVS
ncbi:FAD-binding oxidoreductase [Glutamicibacter sp. JL.03c]|uniref:NAD(P)/FAD-dependent oxidoreductase n=1 Tax=Glutamicibacter sp. JL.03c TaxID=2984842 RepID=UPI0021F75278|nr:FAD-dependent oxidoreductase [Glutamicibacter sp. JL.03c]UYQ76554.1 FAD-binding oxidoreductase [Glutamicibacter sp. JL.03c]